MDPGGANQGESWFALAVSPGEHHLCAKLQSSWFDEGAELAHLTAEPGKSYFFRTRLFTSQNTGLFEFEPVDSDEAGDPISLYPMAMASAKKSRRAVHSGTALQQKVTHPPGAPICRRCNNSVTPPETR